jgi:hypothetical protein
MRRIPRIITRVLVVAAPSAFAAQRDASARAARDVVALRGSVMKSALVLGLLVGYAAGCGGSESLTSVAIRRGSFTSLADAVVDPDLCGVPQ